MVGALLTRGMLVGILAGILSFGFLKLVGEPPVDRAIAFETAMDEAKDKARADEAMAKGMTMPKQDSEPELVSRSVQSGIGLFTGVTVYNTAFGGLFAADFTAAVSNENLKFRRHTLIFWDNLSISDHKPTVYLNECPGRHRPQDSRPAAI